MKVAILAPIAWRTPPHQYGPWEQVVSNLANGLVSEGLDVTLFATSDSITRAKLRYTAPMGYAEATDLDPKVEECLHISHVLESAGEFDIIHNHFDFLPLTYSKLVDVPMVTTIHGFSSPKIIPVYKKYNGDCQYISISDANRHPTLDYLATVYNGIDTTQFDYVETPGKYLLFFGRIHPEKGAHSAIEVARRTGFRLIIAGLIQDEYYYQTQLRPYIDGDRVTYVGNVGPAERKQLLGGAYALLHLIGFDEPFGLSVAESMLCGTPVIAIARGAMSELIRDGETGFLVQNVDGAVAAVDRLSSISRRSCNQWAKRMFSMEKMVQGYIVVYRRILGSSLY